MEQGNVAPCSDFVYVVMLMLFTLQRPFADNNVLHKLCREVQIPVFFDPIRGLFDAPVDIGLFVVGVEEQIGSVHAGQVNLCGDLYRLTPWFSVIQLHDLQLIPKSFLKQLFHFFHIRTSHCAGQIEILLRLARLRDRHPHLYRAVSG